MNNATRPTDVNGNSYNRNLLVLVLMVGSFCTFLNSTLMNTAFPAIMKDFSITTATVQWLTTGFMMVNGVMIPISAWLINRFSSKTMYLWAMLTFLLGTVVSFTAQNFGILLLGRYRGRRLNAVTSNDHALDLSTRKTRRCYGDSRASDRACTSFRANTFRVDRR